MAKARSKKAARSVAAKKKPKSKRSVSKKQVTRALTKKTPKNGRGAASKKGATRKVKKAAPKKPRGTMSCEWTITDYKALYSQNDYTTTFYYTRTNPEDAQVRVRYSSSPNGPIDNEIQDVGQYDSGAADCSGKPHPPWTPLDLIPAQHWVEISLNRNGTPKATETFKVQNK